MYTYTHTCVAYISADVTDCTLVILDAEGLFGGYCTGHVLLALEEGERRREGGKEGEREGRREGREGMGNLGELSLSLTTSIHVCREGERKRGMKGGRGEREGRRVREGRRGREREGWREEGKKGGRE